MAIDSRMFWFSSRINQYSIPSSHQSPFEAELGSRDGSPKTQDNYAGLTWNSTSFSALSPTADMQQWTFSLFVLTSAPSMAYTAIIIIPSMVSVWVTRGFLRLWRAHCWVYCLLEPSIRINLGSRRRIDTMVVREDPQFVLV